MPTTTAAPPHLFTALCGSNTLARPISLRLGKAQRERVNTLAQAHDLRPTDLIRAAITLGLDELDSGR